MGSDYINNKEFEGLIKLYIDSTRESKKKSKDKKPAEPILCECIANYFYLLSDNIVRAFRFSLVDEEDAKQEAVLVCLKKIDKFDIERGKAFNYFTTMILNHYRQLYRSARNYGELKRRFLERRLLSIPQNLRKGLVWHDSDPREND